MNSLHTVKTLTWSSGGDSGAELDLGRIPTRQGDKFNYVDSLSFIVSGTFTNSSGGNVTFAYGDEQKLLKRLSLDIPGLKKSTVNVRGIDAAKVYRAENAGARYVGAEAQGLVANLGTAAVQYEAVIQFSRPNARDADDGAIPAALLRDATLKVEYCTNGDVITGTTFAGTIRVVAHCSARSELVIPRLSSIESNDFTAGTTEPNVDRQAGRVVTLLAARQNGALWANTDFPKVGISFGSHKLSEDSQSAADLYFAFDRGAVDGVNPHTSAGAVYADDFMPIVFPAYNKAGQRVTDTPDASTKMRIYTDTAAAAWSLVRRAEWDGGEWEQVCAQRLGVPASALLTPKTASGKPANGEIAHLLPKKVRVPKR